MQSLFDYQKIKILLVWWYDRKDLWEPFKYLSSDFEFVLLFYKYKEQDPSSSWTKNFRKIYFIDYKSGNQILNDVSPDKVVFMGVDSGYAISLNMACRKCMIPTIYLEHGLRDIHFTLESEKNNLPFRINKEERFYNQQRFHGGIFMMRSLNFSHPISLFILFKFLLDRFRGVHIQTALFRNRFILRNASKYLVFTKKLGSYLIDRDDVKDSQLIPIGNPFYDELISNLNNNNTSIKDQILLIDQPLVSYSLEDKIRLYGSLNTLAKKLNCKLIIKLHPIEYKLYKDLVTTFQDIDFRNDNISFHRYVSESKYIVGYFSSLLLPIIPYKPVIILDVIELPRIINDIIDIGVVFKLNLAELRALSETTVTQLINLSENVDNKSMAKYVEQYLFDLSGNSLDRLRTNLN